MIDIVALNELHYDRMGVYRIWFGHKFYIGSTKNTTNRIKLHYANLQECFTGTGVGRNAVTMIVVHLVANPWINTAYFELLEPCEKEIDLVDAEHDWLSSFEGHPGCLNVNFQVNRVIAGIIVRPNGEIRVKKDGKYIHRLQ